MTLPSGLDRRKQIWIWSAAASVARHRFGFQDPMFSQSKQHRVTLAAALQMTIPGAVADHHPLFIMEEDLTLN